MNQQKNMCRYGSNCYKKQCTFKHPSHRNVSKVWVKKQIILPVEILEEIAVCVAQSKMEHPVWDWNICPLFKTLSKSFSKSLNDRQAEAFYRDSKVFSYLCSNGLHTNLCCTEQNEDKHHISILPASSSLGPVLSEERPTLRCDERFFNEFKKLGQLHVSNRNYQTVSIPDVSRVDGETKFRVYFNLLVTD